MQINCLKDIHTGKNYTVNSDGTHSYTCDGCQTPVTKAHLFNQENKCACGLVRVTTEEELRAALRVDGGKIILGADIITAGCIHVSYSSEIDMAGYDITSTDETSNELWVYGSLKIYDSVGGSSIKKGFNTYDGAYLEIGNVTIPQDDPFGMEGTVNMTGYKGAEIKSYVAYITDITLPEGYVFYDELKENILPDFASAKEDGWVYITPVSTTE